MKEHLFDRHKKCRVRIKSRRLEGILEAIVKDNNSKENVGVVDATDSAWALSV